MNQIEPGIVLTECLNPGKRHLFELPTYQGVKSPPVYDEYDIFYFIPIFQTRPYDMTIEHHAVRSALWALNSFIANTDCENVMFRLYCEEQVKARICAKLEQEGVNPDDWVVWFDGEPFEGDPQTHLGKTLAYMVDARFVHSYGQSKGILICLPRSAPIYFRTYVMNVRMIIFHWIGG